MKRFVSLIILVASFVSCKQYGSEGLDDLPQARLAINVASDDGVLVGVANRDSFDKNPLCSEWFVSRYNKCQFNKTKLDSLNLFLGSFEIKAFIGTWCPDSRRELPRFYRLMDQINYKQFDMICLNRDKIANGLEKSYNIKYVPTFILLKQGKEVGRFIENSTTGSLESDLLTIVQQKNYRPSR